MTGETDRIPTVRIGDLLLVTLQGSIRDRLATGLQNDLADAVVARPTRAVLIDVSGLDVVDSFMSRTIARTAAMAEVLGAETVVTGMQPAVAITLVELGVSMPRVRTALSMDKALAMLRTPREGDRRTAEKNGRPA